MEELPLLRTWNDPRFNRRSRLAETIRSIDLAALHVAYEGTVEAAPTRTSHKERFFVGHDGGGGVAKLDGEKVRAKAIFNSSSPLVVGQARLEIVDYEVPLRGSRADAGVGELDLVGIDRESRRLWIIELKVYDNMETPLKALLQCLRYGAIVEANRVAIESEAADQFGVELKWPAVLAIAADTAYWAKMLRTTRAGEWLAPLRALSAQLTERIGSVIHLLDLGDLRAEVDQNGRAQLCEPVTAVQL